MAVQRRRDAGGPAHLLRGAAAIKSQDKAAPGDLLSDVIEVGVQPRVRLIGAGAIAIAAIWTLLKIMGPIVRGITSAMQSTRARREGTAVDSPSATSR